MKPALRTRLYTVKKGCCVGLLATCCSLLASAQDIHFSQFFEAPLLTSGTASPQPTKPHRSMPNTKCQLVKAMIL
jgi:hypothetical protein